MQRKIYFPEITSRIFHIPFLLCVDEFVVRGGLFLI